MFYSYIVNKAGVGGVRARGQIQEKRERRDKMRKDVKVN